MKECLEINSKALEELQDYYGERERIKDALVEMMVNHVNVNDADVAYNNAQDIWAMHLLYQLF